MKKACLFLLLVSLQKILIVCSSTELEIPTQHPRIHLHDHLATTAALVSIAKQEDTAARDLHFTSIGILAAKLTTEEAECMLFTKTSKKYSPLVFPESPERDTFCMVISPHETVDSIRRAKNEVLALAEKSKPVALFSTHKKEFSHHHTIFTLHNESNTKCRVIIPRFNGESETLHTTTTPQFGDQFAYNIKNQRTFTSMLTPLPEFPNHRILILAASAQEISDKTKIVKIWALPKES